MLKPAMPLAALVSYALLACACLGPGGVVPETTLLIAPAAVTNHEVVTFTFSSDDSLATFECSLDEAAFAVCASPMDVRAPEEREHKFKVKAVSGGTEDPTPAEWHWVVDTSPPDTSIVTAPTGTVASSDVQIEFSSTEEGVTFTCKIDNEAPETCTSGKSYSGLQNGDHKFVVRATDPAGNPDPTPAEWHWVVDTQGPVVTLQVAPTANGAVPPTVQMSFSSPDAVTFECQLDDQGFASCQSPVTFSGLVDGTQHTFHVRATDPVGNVGSDSSRDFVVDGKGPVVTIMAPAEGDLVGPNGAVSFSVDDTSAGVTLQCKLNGQAVDCNGSGVARYQGLSDGDHTFTVQGVDALGNQGPPATVTFTVDATGPVVTISSPRQGSLNGTSVSVMFGELVAPGTISNATFTCSLDGAPAASCQSPWQLDGLSTGQHVVTITATDPVGNVGQDQRTFEVAEGVNAISGGGVSSQLASSQTGTAMVSTVAVSGANAIDVTFGYTGDAPPTLYYFNQNTGHLETVVSSAPLVVDSVHKRVTYRFGSTSEPRLSDLNG